MTSDERVIFFVFSAVRVIGWIIIGTTIVLCMVFLRPIVQMVAGRETLVDVNISATVSIGLNIVGGTVIWRLVKANKGLKQQLAALHASMPRKSKKGQGAKARR